MNAMFILGGLALFLYGIDLMSKSLKLAAGNRLKKIIEKATNAVWKGLLIGIILTVLIQSSSAVTVLIIGLVSVDLMTLKQAIAVIIGANIGTTITSILIGLPISSWGLWFVLVGVILYFIFQKKVPKYLGKTIIGFGLVFVGLNFLGDGVKAIAESAKVEAILKSFSDPSTPGFWFYGFGFSTVFTLVVQSSSAAIGVVQKLYAINEITLIGAIPMVLGANLGTTITGMIASIRGNRNAKRIALVHVFYNLLAAIIFLAALVPFSMLMQLIEDNMLSPNSMMTLAFGHVLINSITMLFFLPFIKPIEKLVRWLIKDKEEKDELSKVLDESLLMETPSVALTYVKSGIFMMGDLMIEYMQIAKTYSFKNDEKLLEEAKVLEEKIDNYDKRLHDYMIKLVRENHLSNEDSRRLSAYLATISDIERIGDHLTNIMSFYSLRYSNGEKLTDVGKQEIEKFYELISKMTLKALGSFAKRDINQAQEAFILEDKVDATEKEFRNNYTERLKKGEVNFTEQSNYIDILSNLERIGDHLNNIAENVILIYSEPPKGKVKLKENKI